MSAVVKNTGKVPGAEVAQLYVRLRATSCIGLVLRAFCSMLTCTRFAMLDLTGGIVLIDFCSYLGFPAAAGEPPLQLKGFVKTSVLAPGEEKTVTFDLDARSVSIWDVDTHQFTVVPGTYTAVVGASSRDHRLHGTFKQ